MKEVATDATRLRQALADRRRVSTWLGYGEVLFLGIGDEILPAPQPGEPRPRAPIVLHANNAVCCL